ncbi:MAG: cysteine desulfurase [Myxococcales bacterium]|nr:cysteine desulfurase [Myxococcales bacterium]
MSTAGIDSRRSAVWWQRIRKDFPILDRRIHGKPLTYLDSASTSQKPRCVLETLQRYYERSNANVHRAIHLLAEEATFEYEKARGKVKRLLGADDPREIVFTSGTTAAINLVAQSYVRPMLQEGDEILITHMEHHSNIVPWQMVCEQTGARLRVAPIDDRGVLDLDEFQRLLGPRTRFASFTHVSNVLGTVNPVREMTDLAHRNEVRVLIDGAQAVQHGAVDLAEIGADFYAFSGHKLYGPTGIGALYARGDLLHQMPPWQGGGEMIESVSFEKTVYHAPPHKFEAGTPNIAGAIGLGAAIDYLLELGLADVARHEAEVLEYGMQVLSELEGVRLIGTAPEKASVISFAMEAAHPHDVATILDREGVAARAGHHCAQPLMERFGLPATTRASLAVFNTREDFDRLAGGLRKVNEIFG